MGRIWELEALRHDRFILWVAIATLPLFSSNTYYVYNKLSVLPEPWRERVSLGVALIIAGFIIIYTLRKNYRMAKYYAYFEAFISAYYYIDTIGWAWPLLPAFGFVMILPASLYHCTKEIEKNQENEMMVPLSNVNASIRDKDDIINHMKQQIEIHVEQYNQLREEYDLESYNLKQQLEKSRAECAKLLEICAENAANKIEKDDLPLLVESMPLPGDIPDPVEEKK